VWYVDAQSATDVSEVRWAVRGQMPVGGLAHVLAGRLLAG